MMPKTPALFLLLGIVWGSNFIYMKMASASLSAAQITFLRVLFGFLPILLYAWKKRVLKAAHLRHLPHFAAMALLAAVLYYYGFAAGTSRLHSGVAGALSASIPIFSFLLALALLKEERLSRRRALGALAGCIGVVLLSRPFAEGAGAGGGGGIAATNIIGVLYMTAGSFSVGASFVYAKKYIVPLNIPALALVTYQLGAGLLILACVTPFDGMSAIWQDAHAAAGMVVGLGFLGTGIAYIIYYHLVATLGAVSASSVTYLPPIVALFIGATFANEPIGMLECAATALIFGGVMLISKKPNA